MEFLYQRLRDNESSSRADSISMGKKLKVGLLVFDEKPLKEAHIVLSTRNLTQSITKNKIPSSLYDASKDNPMIRIPAVYSSERERRPCLLSTHGLRRRHESLNQTLSLLPLTVCSRHGMTSFLPLDYVKRMGEYTRTTYNYPIFKVVHRFHDCVLEFPIPPPIGSSEGESSSSDLHYSNNCYQCFTPLSPRKTAYIYRDYLFCCHGCRLRACVTRYWYKKVMKSAEEEHIDSDEDAMDKDAVFTISS